MALELEAAVFIVVLRGSIRLERVAGVRWRDGLMDGEREISLPWFSATELRERERERWLGLGLLEASLFELGTDSEDERVMWQVVTWKERD